MRPQQQNRRMRGRNNNGGNSNNNNNNNSNNNNNNRRGPNPLTRSYESNGPDVKIRGSAQQIAEKYTTLARDSHSSGDRVMAENYLQHAEHYNRIIAAAQAQMPIQNFQQPRNDLDDDMEEDGDEFGQQQPQQNLQQNAPQQQTDGGMGPQPVIEGTPAEVALNADNGDGANQDRQPRFNGEAPGDADGEFGPRRNRRPRRGRGRQEQGPEQGQGQESDTAGEPATGVSRADDRGDDRGQVMPSNEPVSTQPSPNQQPQNPPSSNGAPLVTVDD